MEDERITRDDLFLRVASLFALRSTCTRAQVGAVAVQSGRIVATGYGGAPAGLPHCLDSGCNVEGDHCVRTVHAEANVVAWASRAGIPLLGASLFCTHRPCLACAKLIINSGIERVVWDHDYGTDDGIRLLHQAGLEA